MSVVTLLPLLYGPGHLQVQGFDLVSFQDIVGQDIPCDGKAFCQVSACLSLVVHTTCFSHDKHTALSVAQLNGVGNIKEPARMV